MGVSETYGTLHLLPSAPAPLVSAARRVLLAQVHADRPGGDAAAATAINTAADLVLMRLQRGA